MGVFLPVVMQSSCQLGQVPQIPPGFTHSRIGRKRYDIIRGIPYRFSGVESAGLYLALGGMENFGEIFPNSGVRLSVPRLLTPLGAQTTLAIIMQPAGLRGCPGQRRVTVP